MKLRPIIAPGAYLQLSVKTFTISNRIVNFLTIVNFFKLFFVRNTTLFEVNKDSQ